jgi:dATP pyrophosphohydrolase
LWSHDTIVIPEYTYGFECGSKIVISSEHNGFALYELNCRLLEACQIGDWRGKHVRKIKSEVSG